MNALSPFRLLALIATTAVAAQASPELESLRERCMMQEERIRELEARLGIRSSPQTADKVSTDSTYQVASGDTLEGIARRTGSSLPELLAANNMEASTIIHPGQKIRIPSSKPKASAAPEAPTKQAVSARTYKVEKGDTFSAIARKNHVSLADLMAANPEIKPTALRPGQVIILTNSAAESPTTEPNRSKSITEPKPKSRKSSAPPAPKKRIQLVQIDREMTYREFAEMQGTTTVRLNQLNGLDLIDAARLMEDTELLAPTTSP